MSLYKISLSSLMKTLKSGIFIILFFVSNLGIAQGVVNEQAEYLKAKEYFNNGEYNFAVDLFGKLSKGSGPISEYSQFYFALSAYKNDQLGLARSMWLQIETKNNNWIGISDVYYWLSRVYFDEKEYDKGVYYAKKSELTDSEGLIIDQLSKVDSIPILEEVHYIYPFEKSIATVLADRLIEVPISERNFQLLQTIVEKFELDREKYGLPEIGQSTFKKEYKVAVLLPFLFDGLESATRTARNTFIMDLYAGMSEAINQLNESSESKIRLVPYDTRRNAETVNKILELEELRSMDLLVGPLFPEPVRLVSDFSFENKINMINPLSLNSDLIRYNPYSFLFRPTVETQALIAAEMVIDSLDNKNVMIFYEDNTRDSLSAYTYSQRIQEAGFNVLLNKAVVDTTIQSAFEMLTEKFELVYSEEEKDSLLVKDEDAIIKERKSIEEKDVIEYYEEFFKISPDSIGHIYMASSKPLYASNIISAIEVRADSTVIVGRGEWKNFATITFEELERLGVLMIDPDYINRASAEYKAFGKLFMKKYRAFPSTNNIIGFDMMDFAGSMLQRFGNYFQNGTSSAGFERGKLFYGTNFRFSNSNQFVPITTLVNSKTTVINVPTE